MILVKSKIKEVAGDNSVSGDFAESLNELAVHLVKDAAKRAKANSRKTIQAKDVYVGEISEKNMMVSKSKVKEISKDNNFSGDFAEALNEILAWHLKQACKRAEANGRKTVSGRDL